MENKKRIDLTKLREEFRDFKEQMEQDLKTIKELEREFKSLSNPLKLHAVCSYDEDADDDFGKVLGKWSIIYASFDEKKAIDYAKKNLFDEDGEPTEYPDSQIVDIDVDFGIEGNEMND